MYYIVFNNNKIMFNGNNDNNFENKEYLKEKKIKELIILIN